MGMSASGAAGNGVGGRTDVGEAGSAGEDGRKPDCLSNNDCQGVGPSHLCLGGSCLHVTSDDCPIVIGANPLPPEPILFGAFGRFDISLLGSEPLYWNFRLAVREFADRGGIPIDGVNRRPMIVLCSGGTGEGPDALNSSLDHLLDELRVPGVLMLTPAADVEYAAGYAAARAQHAFMLHHLGAGQRLLELDDDDLIWHMRGSNLDIAAAYVPLVERIEQRINPDAPSSRPTRLVLTMYDDGHFMTEMAQLLTEMLRINERPAADQAVEGNFVVVVRDGSSETTADAVAGVEPDIVVDLTGESFLLSLIDNRMGMRGAPLPLYVLPLTLSQSDVLASMVGVSPSLRQRVVGVDHAGARDQSLYDLYLARLKPLAPFVSLDRSEQFYDAAYFLFLSAAAGARESRLEARDLAAGMRRLIQGERYDIGSPARINQILDRLTSDSDATLSLYATLGPPEFDPATGTRIGTAGIWCFDEGHRIQYDVLRFIPETGELEGNFPCFDL
jgi:hypothetical protein